jgi:hypothetical protein
LAVERGLPRRGDAKKRLLMGIHYPFEAVFENGNVEVDEQTKDVASRIQVGNDLSFVNLA